MSEPIQIAIISASLAAFINCIFQLVNKIIDQQHEERIYKRSEEKTYLEKKEKAYISAIRRLMEIKVGFDYTEMDVYESEDIQTTIEKNNEGYMDSSPLLRLYASDEIYNMYYNLERFSVYAYSDGWRLIEDAKTVYSVNITILARRMQDDLGFRQYSRNYEKIECPECGIQHDAYSKCPNCGLEYQELQEKLQRIFEQMRVLNGEQRAEDMDE